MGALESVLNTVLTGVAGLNDDFNRRQQRDNGEAAVTKALTTQAEKASQEGDWEWLHDNEQALVQRIHPDHLQAILSTTTLNNARRYDAEVAEGGRSTIPLSPKNIYLRGTQQKYSIDNRSPEELALQANSGPYNGEVGGFAQPGFPTSGGGGAAPDPHTGVSNYQAPSFVGKPTIGISSEVTPADMSTARQPGMAAMQPLAPQGSAEYDAQHAARRIPTGNFTQLDQALGGEYSKGNINLNNRPVQWHDNGKDYSSLESMSFNENGKEILIPQVVNGKLLSADAAIDHYHRTGEHLGQFATPEEATQHAIALERRQQAYYENGPGKALLNKGPDTGITLPTPRRPSSMTLDFGGTKITKSAVPHTSEGITSSAMSQALAQGKSVNDAIQAVNNYNVEAAKKGLPGVAVDHSIIQQAQTKQFNDVRMAEEQRLLQNGSMEPALAHQAAARYASQQLGGFIPTNFDGVVGYTPEERHTARVNQAMSFANMQLDGAMKVIAASKQPSDVTSNVLYDIVNQTPGLSLQDKHAVLIDSAQRLAQQLAPKLQASGAVTGPLAMIKAIQIAGSMTGGQVPAEWHKAVANNASEFGLSPQATELYLTGRYNIFKPGGMATLNAAALDRTVQLDQLKSMSPEAAAASLDALQQRQSTAQVLRAGGKTQRNIEVEQDAAKTTATVGARETQERKESVKASMPMLKELTDAMHAVQNASKLKSFVPGTDANNAVTLYEDKMEAFKNAVAKGLLGQSGNLTKNEQDDAKAALVGLWEARFKPDVAKQKVETINRLLSKHYGQRIDLNALDPFNPDAAQPRVYGKDAKPVTKDDTKPAAEQPAAKPPAGVRLYDNKGARVK